jgi:hypothetical protein
VSHHWWELDRWRLRRRVLRWRIPHDADLLLEETDTIEPDTADLGEPLG